MLLIGAGLMIKSTLRLLEVKLGFRPEGLMTMQLELPAFKYSNDDQARIFHRQMLTRVEALPGVIGAATVNWLPMQPGPGDLLLVEGRTPPPPGAEPKASTRVVSSTYFRTMGVSLLNGRDFSDRDSESSPGVIIINNALANRLFTGQDPIGHRIAFAGEEPHPYEIIGIVDDERVGALDEEAVSVVYRPYEQSPWTRLNLVVRTPGDPQSIVNAVRGEIRTLDQDLAIYSVAAMDQLVADTPSTFLRRYPALLMTVFAAIALILATVGIYGVISYSVSQRTRELGIRMALGAPRSRVLLLVLGDGMAKVLAGIALGLAGSLVLTRVMTSLLFEVTPTDPMTLVGISLLLAAVASLACLIPARRATRVDPMAALRHE
jgi:putative ABC transport system permease protein